MSNNVPQQKQNIFQDYADVFGYDTPKTQCPESVQLITADELDEDDPSWLVEAVKILGGKIADQYRHLVSSDSIELVFGASFLIVPRADVRFIRTHQWVDNGGLMRTWCKHCNADGEWCRDSYSYKERER